MSPALGRRVVLSMPLGAAALALGACGAPVPVPASEPEEAGSTLGDAVATALMPRGTEEVTVDLGPLVRVEVAGAEGSVLPLHVTRSREADVAEKLAPGQVLLGGLIETLGSYKPLRLVDTTGLRVWTTTSTQSRFETLAPGDEQDLVATFGPVDTASVIVLLPGTGLVEVPVVDADDPSAPALDLPSVARTAVPDQRLASPVALERHIESTDGASAAVTDEETTVVDLAGDVTFDVDSAELTADAESALNRRVEVAIAPSRGTGDALVRNDGEHTLPEAAGAVGGADRPLEVTGPEGLGRLSIEVERVTRSGSLLLSVPWRLTGVPVT
ncbi:MULTISPECIES: hypothetical protein [unclassified Actinomyces]|uniref:hypothetical protein n=1 Tax=unclassified Actinomyces TaxID=2609248 RepID=UPI002016AF46|nr:MULTISPECIES: hypothetical protein [unclassified Actinomyces]MCL3777083.1 hypothetical protein [Actinomyces sp. AC-20-1]MCL3789905.1 hypothetical protein [Actinomyces sp. 187325]MCL3792991.1 hypothetical protein [Actinomyces sp. 186855]MCL3795407.1 hypothetical protein [Actinomyces sp. 217892]